MRNYTESLFEVIVAKNPNEGLDNNHGSVDDTIVSPSIDG